MENQQPTQPEHSPKIDSNLIGIRKYEFLKSLKPETLSEEQLSQISVYESKRTTTTPEQSKLQHEYFDKILAAKKPFKFEMSSRKLWELFRTNFQEVNKRPFIKIEGVTVKNLEPIIYYFTQDKRFFDCENLSKLSEPSFDKGLLIIGNFGNGKTSAVKVFEKIFKGIPGIGFKGYSANEAVTMFEKCSTDADRDEFEKTMWRGVRYFDDLKTERMASNFGKVNVFKDILEERYNRSLKTYITCNFKEGFEGDLDVAIDEFGEKYGGRVHDRIFEMFNIIEFKGKSFRK